MPTLKAKCLAIAHDLGLPPLMFEGGGGAAAVLKAACREMGITPEPGQSLPSLADVLAERSKGSLGIGSGVTS